MAENRERADKINPAVSDEAKYLNRRVMDMLQERHVGADGNKIALDRIYNVEENAPHISFEDILGLDQSARKQSPTQNQAEAIVYSLAAKDSFDKMGWVSANALPNRITSQLSAAILADKGEASVQKGLTSAEWNHNIRKTSADLISVGAMYAAREAVNYLAAEGNLWARVGAGVASLAVGGALNNVVAGRDLTDFSGYARNALGTGLLHYGLESLPKLEAGFLSRMSSGYAMGVAYKSIDYLSGEEEFKGQKSLDDMFSTGLYGALAFSGSLLLRKGVSALPLALTEKAAVNFEATTGLLTIGGLSALSNYEKQSSLDQYWNLAVNRAEDVRVATEKVLKASQQSSTPVNEANEARKTLGAQGGDRDLKQPALSSIQSFGMANGMKALQEVLRR